MEFEEKHINKEKQTKTISQIVWKYTTWQKHCLGV